MPCECVCVLFSFVIWLLHVFHCLLSKLNIIECCWCECNAYRVGSVARLLRESEVFLFCIENDRSTTIPNDCYRKMWRLMLMYECVCAYDEYSSDVYKNDSAAKYVLTMNTHQNLRLFMQIIDYPMSHYFTCIFAIFLIHFWASFYQMIQSFFHFGNGDFNSVNAFSFIQFATTRTQHDWRLRSTSNVENVDFCFEFPNEIVVFFIDCSELRNCSRFQNEIGSKKNVWYFHIIHWIEWNESSFIHEAWPFEIVDKRFVIRGNDIKSKI